MNSNNRPLNSNNSETRRLLIVSGITNVLLGLIKVLVGTLSNSYALVIDGIHSLSDLVTDLMVWYFNHIGAQGPDKDHPYGHAKFETFGTLILGCLLILLAFFLVYDSVTRLLSLETYTIPAWPALLAAAISIAGKEWLYQITIRLGIKTKSRLLQANAWHHRTDAFSSIIVLVGIGGALMGIPWLELVAAIGVALMIAMIGWTLCRQSVSELVDTALSESYVADMKLEIQNVEGVQGVHSIRTRSMGSDAFVDIHLQVKPSISVSEGHQIGEWVTKRLLGKFPEINDVIVHIDPEDDQYLDSKQITELAPLREEVKIILGKTWQASLGKDNIIKMILHYLNNQIHIEVFLKTQPKTSQEKEALRSDLIDSTKHLSWLKQVSIWYE